MNDVEAAARSRIQELESALAKATRELEALERDRANVEASLARRAADLDQAWKSLRAREQDLDAQWAAIQDQETRTQEVSRVRSALTAQERRLDDLRAELDARHDEIQSRERELDEREAELERWAACEIGMTAPSTAPGCPAAVRGGTPMGTPSWFIPRRRRLSA